MKVTSVIMAAGFGKRMHSALPKVMHTILGVPLIGYALQAAQAASDAVPVVIVGHGKDLVRAAVADRARCVEQPEQLGTAHAVRSAAALLRGQTDLVLVTNGDMPLLRAESLRCLVDLQRSHNGPLTLLTVSGDDARGYGRVVRNPDGSVNAIVEEAQATPEQLAIREYNVSAYCFAADWLWPALERVPLSPKGEYYLTDVVGLAAQAGLPVQAVTIADPLEAIGINTRVHLAEATTAMRQRINTAWMEAGVSLIDPATTYIEPSVQIGVDSTIWPNTFLQGSTSVGEASSIGPNTIVQDTQIGSRCRIQAAVLEGALVEDEVSMGPFVHLRTGAHLGRGVHMGNFGEVKSSYLGAGTKMGHFSYIGNATIGENVNIGAGTITCNFDGTHKHPTEIGNDVFIGSDTMLVAPVKIGEGARTGAGSVVTHDVPPHTLVVGVPARPLRKLEESD